MSKQDLRVGDRVKFTKAGKHFHPECDNGVIVAEFNHFDRPFLVRWDHGVETRPVVNFLSLISNRCTCGPGENCSDCSRATAAGDSSGA